MRVRIFVCCLVLGLTAGGATAQKVIDRPNETDVYCSGMITTDLVPTDTYLISGEESNTKLTFQQGDIVYINKGSSQGVKVGDEFLVQRAVKDVGGSKWFKWQPGLLRAMGKAYADLGRLRVMVVQPNTATAQIVFSCDWMQRGDLVRPFQARPAPQYKAAASFDRFAPPSGKAKAMVVVGKDFRQSVGQHDVIYVNLGQNQGVKVGDYFRIFRYQGQNHESAYQTWRMSTRVYGFGSSQRHYRYEELPREILGEGIVLRTGPNSATVFITHSVREIYAGSYIEIE